MQAIVIVIIVLVVLVLVGLLVFLLLRKNKENPEIIYGGEGIPIEYENNGRIDRTNITFSEMVVEEQRKNLELVNIVNKPSSIAHFFEDTVKKCELFSKIMYRGGNGFIIQNTFPKYFSDALVDGILLFVNNDNKIDRIICKNEFPSENIYNPELIGKINEGFIDYSKNNPSFLLQSNKNLVSIEKNKELESVENRQNIYIFIEFSYPSSINRKFFVQRYKSIHARTCKTISSVIQNSAKSLYKNQIYLIRIENDKLEKPVVLKEFKLNDNTMIYKNNWNDSKYMSLNIPKTEKSFDMDEFLIAQSKDMNYLIQVEHSEGEGNHKSNMVEFILRTCNYLKISVDDTFKIVNQCARIQTNDFVYGYYLRKFQESDNKKDEIASYVNGIKSINDGEKLFIKKIDAIDLSKDPSVFQHAYPNFFEKYIKQNSDLYNDFVKYVLK